jgi:vitamin B12 transporter
MIRLFIFLALILTTNALADNSCEWADDTPCVVISKGINNSNAIGDKISPTIIINKSDIEKYNLTDLNKVLNHVQGVDVTQSGPTGQQSSVFLRGTNSNHTLVLLNGIPINDHSTPTGAHDVGQDFMSTVQQIDVYKGSAGAHWGADAVGAPSTSGPLWTMTRG